MEEMDGTHFFDPLPLLPAKSSPCSLRLGSSLMLSSKAFFSSHDMYEFGLAICGSKPGLWGMTTSVIQRKGLSKDYCVHRKWDPLVSQKWRETP